MNWENFIYFAAGSLSLWILGVASLYLFKRAFIGKSFIIAGLTLFALFIAGLWQTLGHPPLRTMGETRLWYSFFLVLVGFITYIHWGYRWLMGYSVLVSGVFIFINLLKPEIHTTNLMPALQSVWFVPHVTVYILSYAMFGAATIASIIAIVELKRDKNRLMPLIDNLVYIGFGFLMLGMLMGAIWAKEAWGDYWTWDPKEVWAFITASFYLIYIHSRVNRYPVKYLLWLLPLSFIMLMITWIGVNYLPAAQGSIHVY
ncbi:MAG: cytochrome c biogenesis protein CcsA [Bacteroidales bacterium]|jgi:ABC-type transport system involved in cytochrome c biogenesis permease subunit|nr:cytochrome c biogenesis protein CcsA [Bacteroidales bacterium]